MTKEYFFSLYWRNIKGAFKAGALFDGSSSNDLGPTAFFLILHVIFLPITLTFGAAILTLVDFFTRKFTPQNEISNIEESISNLDSQGMDKLTKNVFELHSPQSKSSRKLVADLSAQLKQEKFAILAEKKQIVIDSLNQACATPQNLLKPTIDLKTLEKSYDNEPRIIEIRKTLNNERLAKSKETLINYIKDEKNNGKKLFQITVSSLINEVDVASSSPENNKSPT